MNQKSLSWAYHLSNDLTFPNYPSSVRKLETVTSVHSRDEGIKSAEHFTNVQDVYERQLGWDLINY